MNKKIIVEQNLLFESEILTNAMQDAFIIIDSVGKIVFWNRRAENIFGYSNSEILGKDLHSVLAPQRYRQVAEAKFEKFKITGKGVAIDKTLELEALRKDGTEFPIELSLSSLNSFGAWQAIGIVRDITQRKKMEAALIQAKEEADAANKAKSDLLKTIAHDLKTPLNGVYMSAQLLEMRLTSPEDTKWINKIKSSSESLIELINELLLSAKKEAGEDNMPVYESVLIKDLIAELQNIPIVNANEERVDFIQEIAREVPESIWSDILFLKRILTNLISNAISFTAKDKKVSLKIQLAGDQLEFIVKDEGVGIPKENHGLIFEEFKQVDSKLNQKRNGTGLGLAIVKELVEKLNGSISLESEVGIGSMFTVRIPLQET